MAQGIKKISFEEIADTMVTMENKIDSFLTEAKKENKGKKVWYGFPNFKTFLKNIERRAVKETAKKYNLGETTIRERWKILTLPTPVFTALEAGIISLSKARLMTAINFDFENDNDIKIAEKIVEEIKKGISVDEIKTLVTKESSKIWNESDITMFNIAKQNGITVNTEG